MPHHDARVSINGGVVEDNVEKILKTSRSRKGCTGIWKNGRNKGKDKTRPEEMFIVGRMRDRVECMMECRVNNSDRRRNALCDNVANVKGRNIKISRKVISL